jgi:hypothetical protein
VSDRPDDVDAAFAEIVADLEREGVGRTLPDLDDLTDTSELPVADDPDSTPPGGNPAPGGLSPGRGLSPEDLPRGLSPNDLPPSSRPPGERSSGGRFSGRFGGRSGGGSGGRTAGGPGNGRSRDRSSGRAGNGDPADRPRSPEPPTSWRGHDAEWDWSWHTDEEHYVPPEPPPLPKLRPLTITALVLVILGVILLIVPTLIGLDARIATPIALLAVTCGGGMLLLRARQNPKDPDARDDGAQI